MHITQLFVSVFMLINISRYKSGNYAYIGEIGIQHNSKVLKTIIRYTALIFELKGWCYFGEKTSFTLQLFSAIFIFMSTTSNIYLTVPISLWPIYGNISNNSFSNVNWICGYNVAIFWRFNVEKVSITMVHRFRWGINSIYRIIPHPDISIKYAWVENKTHFVYLLNSNIKRCRYNITELGSFSGSVKFLLRCFNARTIRLFFFCYKGRWFIYLLYYN